MSRTYRHRHLPVLSGTARKYVDSFSRWRREFEHFSEIWRTVVHDILKFPCTETHKGWHRYLHQSCVPNECWGHANRLVDAIDQDKIWPINGKGGHPWVNWARVAGRHHSVKKDYRKEAYRRIRRRTRQLLNTYFNRDPDSILMPLRNEYLDWWDIY